VAEHVADGAGDSIVIEHPAGKIETRVEAASSAADAVPEIVRAGVVRTARLLLAGRVFVNVPNEAPAA
jgi:2-methylaconitate cis-trans-isomerase PrpF